MSLNIQIYSFIYSFVFGIIVAFLFKFIYKYLYLVQKIYRLLNSFLFITIISLIYFKIMYIINNGIVHLYFLLTTILTFIITYNNLQKKCKKNEKTL